MAPLYPVFAITRFAAIVTRTITPIAIPIFLKRRSAASFCGASKAVPHWVHTISESFAIVPQFLQNFAIPVPPNILLHSYDQKTLIWVLHIFIQEIIYKRNFDRSLCQCFNTKHKENNRLCNVKGFCDHREDLRYNAVTERAIKEVYQ